MNRPVVALDLDDTLLQNRSMIRGVWQHIATTFPEAGVDPDMAYASLQKYYVETFPGLFAYNFDKHLLRHGVDLASAYKSIAASELADGRYEIDNLAGFMTDVQKIADMLIVTFGYDSYQRLKASLCPSLDGIEIITTLESKALVLRQHKSVHYLVDDRPVSNLPDTIKFVMVSLVGKTVDESAHRPVYSSLLEVKEYLYENLH